MLASCILLLPILYNLITVLGIGNYNNNKDFNNDLIEGTGGININFNLALTYDDKYTGIVNIDTISSGSVEKIGITFIDYYINRDVEVITRFTESFNPPRNSLQKTHINLPGDKNNEIICHGTIKVKFLSGGIEQEEIIEFSISIMITISSADISYKWNIAAIWLQIFDYIVIFALILLLIKVIKSIKFDKWYTEEMRKEDEEFFEKMQRNTKKEKTL